MKSFKHFLEAIKYKAKLYDNEDEVGTVMSPVGTGNRATGNIEKNQAKTHRIPISKITTHEPLEKTEKSTASKESERNVKGMMQTLKSGKPIESVMVVRHKTGYRLIDGHHRLEAHKRLGLKHIDAHVIGHRDWKNV